MKQLIFVLLLIPTFVYSQKLDVKKAGEKTELTFEGTYLVQKDTSGSGVITIQLIPTDQLQKELESTLGTLQAEVANLDIRINELQERKRAANREVKEVERLLENLARNRSAPAAIPVNARQLAPDTHPKSGVVKPIKVKDK